MQNNSHRHRPTLIPAALLGLALLAPTLPAQASEVVKLARLVITGQRSDPAAAPDRHLAEVGRQAGVKIERLPPVLIEGRRSEDGVQYAFQRRQFPKAL